MRTPPIGAYTDAGLVSPEQDMDAALDSSVEARFSTGASLSEGISGQLEIDTEYENTSEDHLNVVRSDVTRYENTGAPRDQKRHDYPHRR